MKTELVSYRQYHRFTVSEDGVVWGVNGDRYPVYHVPSIDEEVIVVRAQAGTSYLFSIKNLIKAAFSGETLNRTLVNNHLYPVYPKKGTGSGRLPLLCTCREAKEGKYRINTCFNVRGYAAPDVDALVDGKRRMLGDN